MNRSIYVIYAPLMKGFFVSDEVIACIYTTELPNAKIFADKAHANDLVEELNELLPDTKHHVLTVKCKL